MRSAAQIRFGAYPTSLKSFPADTPIARDVTFDQRVIIELRGDAGGVRVNRVQPSPVQVPDAGIFPVRYPPHLIQPDVVITPGLPAQAVAPEPVITIPQQQPVVRMPPVPIPAPGPT